jgi:hypothetical protein
VGAELFRADRQDEANSRFPQILRKVPKKFYILLTMHPEAIVDFQPI